MAVTLNDTLGVKRDIKHYDFGMPFWEATKQKKLVIQYCKTAKKYQHFPRPVSIFTGRRRDIEWREVSGKGTVFSFTIAHRGPPAFQGAEPYAIASVTLDVGVNVIADVVNCTAEELKVGMKVKPYWHPLANGEHLSDVAARQGRGMSGPQDARGPKAVARFLRPRSVAIIGISTREGSAGQIILQCLKVNNFKGDIYLVGRTDEPIDGRPVLKSPDELPEGVELAVFTLPAAAVHEAIESCARRKVRSAMVFAAGFAEVGDRATQDAVTATARAAGLAVVGPNCLGVTNNVDGMMLHMLYAREALRGIEDGVAFVGQSGGLLGHFQRATDGRGIPLSYVISTGNEAGLETTDFLEFLADDRATRVIALYCEEIRRPQEFLAAVRRARRAGKPVVLMQAGRSAKARKAAQSHTGALIGDFATMQTQVEDAGAVVVSTMDEMMDLVAILQRFPTPPTKGPGILTASGAYVGLTNDFAEEIDLELPELDPATLKKISETLPSYGNYGNPLDTTAGFAPAMLPVVTKALIDDPNVGMLFISFPINTAIPVRAFNEGMAHSPKPKVMVALGDTWQLGADVNEAVKESPAVYSPLVRPHAAGDRALHQIRALACPHARYRRIRAIRRTAQARQGRSTGMARQKAARRGRHSRARRRPRAHGGRSGGGGQADWLSGGSQGAGRGTVAQDRSRRRRAQSGRGGCASRGLGRDDAERQTCRARCQHRRRAGRENVAQGRRADGRRQTRSRLGHSAAAGPRRHLGRGVGRRAVGAGQRRRSTNSRSAGQAPLGQAPGWRPRRAARRSSTPWCRLLWRSAG